MEDIENINDIDKSFVIKDSPITDENQDKLGWNRIADELSNIIIEKSEDSFVLGISGGWGAGKTSMLNLIKRNIKSKITDIDIINYNPWLNPESDHVKEFFRLLSEKLKIENSKLSKQMMQMAGIVDDFWQHILDIFKWLLGFILASGVLANFYFSQLNVLIFVVICLMLVIGIALKAWLFLEKCKISSESSNLYELKQKISQSLIKGKKLYIVIIDDIDRLPPDDICEIFQLVKNNGNLSHVNYILSYDEQIIRKSLVKRYFEEYRDFDQKIIQLNFNLPPIDKTILDEFYLSSIGKYKSMLPSNYIEYWSEKEWTDYYYNHVRDWYRSFRDVKRLINGLYSNAIQFNKESIEFNPVELIVIEHIRILWPSLYSFIRSNKNTFVDVGFERKYSGNLDNMKDVKTIEYDKIFKVESIDYAENVKAAISDLFPKVGYGGDSDYVEDEKTKISNERELRICSENIFDRYFLFGNYFGDVPNKLIYEFYNLTIGDEEKLIQKMQEIGSNKSIRRIIDVILNKALLIDYAAFNKRRALNIVFVASDVFDYEDKSKSILSIELLIVRWISQILDTVPYDHRRNMYEDYLRTGKCYFGPLSYLAFQEIEMQNNEEPKEHTTFKKEDIQYLKEFAINKLIKWTKDPESLNHHYFTNIIVICNYWLNEKERIFAYQNLTKTDQQFKKFISRFVTEIPPGEIESNPNNVKVHEFNFALLNKFINLEKIDIRLKELGIQGSDDENYRVACRLFWENYTNYQNNKN